MIQRVYRFRSLEDVRPGDRALVGGKAFNCAVLKQAGLPVPDGLAIPSDATDDEVRRLGESPWVHLLPPGVTLAVRSSGLSEDGADHSFAGMHDTRLNVDRRGLVEAVIACRRSSRSAQALAYRRARDLDDNESGIGILVQRMVPAVISGVAFTVNPITGANELVINAASGLGEDLVSGRVDPDEYRLDKHTAAVLSVRRGSARPDSGDASLLSDARLRTLAGILMRIESHYDAPQDVEWCHDGTQFWVVQSRPVTTRPIATAATAESTFEHPDTEWTRANLAEVFPDLLAPQTLAAYEPMLNRAERMFMGRLLAPDADLGPMFKSFRGRMYLNLSQMRRVVAIIRAPAADMLRSLGHTGEIRPEDEVPAPASFVELLRCLPDLIRIGSYDARAERLLRAHEASTREAIADLSKTDLSASDREIWNTLTEWIASVPAAVQIVFVMSGVLSREVTLKKACAKVGFPYERLVYPQLAAGRRSVSSKQAYALVALADVARQEDSVAQYLLADDGTFKDYRERLAGTVFIERFSEFLDEYGHRGRYESDWSLPRLHEQPAPALFAIRERLHEPPQDAAAAAARQEADAAASWREFEAHLTTWQRWTLRPRVKSVLRRLKDQYVWREQVRSDLTRILRRVRVLHLTMANRFVERGWIEARDDYFLLKFEEIQPAIDDPRTGSALAGIVARRRAEVSVLRPLRMPFLMKTPEMASLLSRMDEPIATGEDALAGLCVSPGAVEAEVVVMRDPGEFATMKRGAILVAPATDPSWTPLFTLASGVIVEVGGMLSHASTIAREYGLPALANVKDATRLLSTGDRVTLDASRGRVLRVPRTEGPVSAGRKAGR